MKAYFHRMKDSLDTFVQSVKRNGTILIHRSLTEEQRVKLEKSYGKKVISINDEKEKIEKWWKTQKIEQRKYTNFIAELDYDRYDKE